VLGRELFDPRVSPLSILAFQRTAAIMRGRAASRKS
jgi:hypothetical protein